ncbi:MAG: GAF domain-containing protein, partial [Limnobacter sp.]|nr:GAF domain-containing protein [Limnobacter sp.]
IAKRVKRLTGFDRVMVYRFASDWSGHVVADEREAGMESYQDLWYPASDIPSQARELYRTNLVRYIADVKYEAVPVLPRNPEAGQILDMSHATLRSVSPVHIQYLKNMGVGSSLVMSIMRGDQLWGLISCHHREPTDLPMQMRRACYSLSITVSYMLNNLLLSQENESRSAIGKLCQEIESSFGKSHVGIEDIIEHTSGKLLQLGASGAGLFWKQGYIYPFGKWPSGVELDALVDYAKQRLQASREDLFFECALPPEVRKRAPFERQLCGMAAINLDSFASTGLLWIRPEHVQEVSWGGDPNKAVNAERDERGRVQLSPRTSFAQWVQRVGNKSKAWGNMERFAITTLVGLKQT